jgi:hypothetical protein
MSGVAFAHGASMVWRGEDSRRKDRAGLGRSALRAYMIVPRHGEFD